MSDPKPAKGLAAAAARNLLNGVGRNVSDVVRQELAANRAADDSHPADPQSAARVAAAALGGFVGGVGQNVSDLLRQELGAARSEVVDSAKAAARGAGLLGGAAVAGQTATIFAGIALWRGLGNRIGYAKSAVVVAAISGAAAVALASSGVAELARVSSTSRGSRQRATAEGSADRRPEADRAL